MGQAGINDRFIKELYIQNHDLEFLMEDENKVYYCCQDCDSRNGSVLLHALPQESGYLCEGELGEQPVKRGVNTFSVRVTNGGKIIREYIISVIVKASPTDISLKLLLVNDQEAVIPEGVEYYYCAVEEDCSQVEIEAITSDPKAVAEGDLGLNDLESGINFFQIRVYSSDRSDEASYQLVMERKSRGAGENPEEAGNYDGKKQEPGGLDYLEKIDLGDFLQEEDRQEGYEGGLSQESRLSELRVEGCRLKPDFSPDIFDYKVEFEGKLDSILVEAVSMNPESGLDGDLGVQSVVTGYNGFSVLCTAPDEITKSLYKYSVEKKKLLLPEAKAGQNGYSEVKGKKRESKRMVRKARYLKLKPFMDSKTQKKSTMSQPKKLVTALLLLLLANYPVYIYYTKPAIQNNASLVAEASHVAERRSSVEKCLSNKEDTIKSIEGYKEKIKKIGDKYPYLPSQEEILYYLDDLQKKIPFTYSAIFIGEPTVMETSDVLNDINAKNIGTIMGDLDLLTPPDPKEAPARIGTPAQTADGQIAGNGQDTGNGQTAPQNHFRKNMLTLTLDGSKGGVLSAYHNFIKDQRLIITDELQFTLNDSPAQGEDGAPVTQPRWTLSFNAYYYQYTGQEERSYGN